MGGDRRSGGRGRRWGRPGETHGQTTGELTKIGAALNKYPEPDFPSRLTRLISHSEPSGGLSRTWRVGVGLGVRRPGSSGPGDASSVPGSEPGEERGRGCEWVPLARLPPLQGTKGGGPGSGPANHSCWPDGSCLWRGECPTTPPHTPRSSPPRPRVYFSSGGKEKAIVGEPRGRIWDAGFGTHGRGVGHTHSTQATQLSLKSYPPLFMHSSGAEDSLELSPGGCILRELPSPGRAWREGGAGRQGRKRTREAKAGDGSLPKSRKGS